MFLWSAREHSRHLMNIHRKDMLKSDGVLAELLFRQKRRLSHLGRGGGWLPWLKQNKISRSTADRLVLQHAETFDLTDELPHRTIAEPLEGDVCLAANRTCDRLGDKLRSPKSRMIFVQVLADLLDLRVESEEQAVRLSIPPLDERDWSHVVVPNVMFMREDGFPSPVDYELREVDADVDFPV